MNKVFIKYNIAQIIYFFIIVISFSIGIVGGFNIASESEILYKNNHGSEHLTIYSLILGSLIYIVLELMVVSIISLFNNSLLYKLFIPFTLSINSKKNIFYNMFNNNPIEAHGRSSLLYQEMINTDFNTTKKSIVIFIKYNMYVAVILSLITLYYTYRIFNS